MPKEPVYDLDGEPLYSCPKAIVDDEAMEAVEMWAWMKNGFLPNAGGMNDQVERDLEMIMAVDAVSSETRG